MKYMSEMNSTQEHKVTNFSVKFDSTDCNQGGPYRSVQEKKISRHRKQNILKMSKKSRISNWLSKFSRNIS